jgi:hypothetical protein
VAEIRLQFVLGASLSSRAVAWWGQGVGGFSHVDAVLDDQTLLGARSDRPGGTPSGVQRRRANYEAWVRREVLTLPNSSGEQPAWQAWLITQIDKPYDMGSIWGFFIGRNEHQPGHWICSALQTAGLERANRLPRLPLHTSQVTPDSLRLMFLALGAR